MAFPSTMFLRASSTAVIAGLSLCAPGSAQAQTRVFSITAQPASSSIPLFGKQAGVQVLASAPDVAGKNTNAVMGAFPIERALKQLLSGTGLVAGPLQNGMVTIRPGKSPLSQPLKESANRSRVPSHPSADTDEPTRSGVSKSLADTGTVEEIIVTAQKRREDLQNVPITISVVSASRLQAAAASNLEDVANLTAGLTGFGADGLTSPHLRGVGTQSAGTGADNAVALYIDGVYIGPYSRALYGLNPDAVSQIEILKGPQGTLFGRNATGGVIQITTRDPEKAAAELKLGYANYDTKSVSGYLSTSADGPLSADISFVLSDQGKGWGTQPSTGVKVGFPLQNIVIYSKILWSPTEDTRFKLSLDYARNKGSLFNYDFPGTVTAYGTHVPATHNVDRDVTDRDAKNLALNKGYGAALHFDHDFANFTVHSTTAYRHAYASTKDGDGDNSPLDIITIASPLTDKQFSEELQLSSTGPGPFSWTAGFYYLHAYTNAFLDLGIGGVPHVITARSVQRTNSYGLYAQATYALTERTSITLGTRYSMEKKTVVGEPGLGLPAISDSIRFEKPSWRASISHQLSDDATVYASFNQGSKGGGFNLYAPGSPKFLPETLKAWEVGAKTELFDRRVRLNVSGFYYKYSNIQVYVIRPPAVTAEIYNGAKATLYGLDADTEIRLTPRLMLSGSIEYLHSRFDSFPDAVFGIALPTGGYAQVTNPPVGAKGNALGYTPKLTGTVAATYTMPTDAGTFALNGSYSYNDGFYGEPDNVLRQWPYSIVSASLTWTSPDDRFTAQLWGKNLTNATYGGIFSTQASAAVFSLNAPRTYGVTVGVKF